MSFKRRYSWWLLIWCLIGGGLFFPQPVANSALVRPIPLWIAQNPPEPKGLERIILEAALQYKIHPALIAAMIEVESGYRPYARSPKGAMGLMQLMPQTARHLGVHQPFDIEENVMGGVKYLRQMLDTFRGNYLLALAAYNAGPDAVQRYGTIPPYYETVQYIPKVAYWYRHYLAKMKKRS
ncbi:MAG: lytic transglycosylase domain-containing protein [Deltaproteobacteria bacterium]|nr:lytic transglycosylase domain-containing protein [Deltaproteobacteria bacterium]